MLNENWWLNRAESAIKALPATTSRMFVTHDSGTNRDDSVFVRTLDTYCTRFPFIPGTPPRAVALRQDYCTQTPEQWCVRTIADASRLTAANASPQ